MGDIRAPSKEVIKEAYETGKYTFKKLSSEFGISLGTIKSWSKRDKDKGIPWIKNKLTKSTIKNKYNNIKKQVESEQVKDIINSKFTDKQKLFCIYYIRCFNATKSYLKAYDCDYITANTNGPRLLGNASIKEEIQKLKKDRFNKALLSEEDIFQKYVDIAFSDITDYVTFGKKKIVVPSKKSNNKTTTLEINYVDLKDSNKIDGTVISQISQVKNNISVKLNDKMKALKWLSDHMDIATEEQKARIEVLRNKVKIDDIQPIKVEFVKASEKNE
ncbi:terminase small subunit [Clostridium oceanicum]|uniref:Terminase small subunit n=1 Tax=Clostridium oceanicum TaxID=1543 RepID=A0ABN1JBX9_9CLOT